MTNLETLKAIATRLSVDLIPVDTLASHCLYINGSAYDRYEDTQLETMTADEFRAIVEEATRQPEVQVLAFGPFNDSRLQSPITGHWLGGERTR
jgi:hypothetical protein